MMLIDGLPTKLDVGGQFYNIYTDFRDWINFDMMIKDKELTNEEKVDCALAMFKEYPHDTELAIDALIDFFTLSHLDWRKTRQKEYSQTEQGKISNTKKPTYSEKVIEPVFSFEYDENFVISAFRQYYNINLLTIKYMHWWEFKALFDGIPDNSKLRERMMYRSIDIAKVTDKEEKARLRRIKYQLALPKDEENTDVGSCFL